MTVNTVVMDLVIRRIDKQWRITVTTTACSRRSGGTFRTRHGHYIQMVICRCRMQDLPGIRMAGLAVAAR